jgi:hypothetical protein
VRAVSDAFAAAVRTSHERVARVTVLASDLSTVAEITGTDGVVIEGSVTTDANRRRSCQLTVTDPAGVWAPAGPGDALFPNGIIRLERGIVVDGNPELVSLGVFMVDRPRVNVTDAGATISLSGQDRAKLAAKSRLSVPETYGSGTPIAEVVLSIASAAGMGTSLFRLDDGGKVLAADRTLEVDTDRWPVIGQLATDFALIAYVDADGSLVLEPAPTPDAIAPAVWTFERGAEAIMLGLTKDFNDDQLYNRVRVSGESSNLPPLAAEARDLNPDSPAYNPVDGSGPIGDRLYSHTSPMVRSIEQAAEVAAALILQVALIEEQLTVPSIVHPALEVGDPVSIVEPLSRTADTYLIDTLQVPLGTGSMTMTARKLRDLRLLG